MICPGCQTENPASARFCFECGTALVQYCSNCQTELVAGARFCMHCGQPVIVTTPADDSRLARLAAAAPDPLAEKVRAAANLAGERRVVTCLLVDVVDSTSLAGQVDIETWTEIMNGAFDRLAAAIYRYEGTLARMLGDSLLAFFGAPIAHEDDPERAVRAALDAIAIGREVAQEVQASHAIEFAIRACINTGQVILGAIGDDLKYDYTPMGNAVNLVSRIKFAARPMTVLISEDTHRLVAPVVDSVDLEPISVKGLARPVRIYQVDGIQTRPGQLRGLAGLSSPIVGRDAELAVLSRLCDAVRAGLGRAVLVVGEPGLGKTRLISEWKNDICPDSSQTGAAPDSTAPHWIEARCLSYGQGLAYHLLIDLVRSSLGIPELAGEQETRSALRAATEDLLGDAAQQVYPFLGHLLSLKLEGDALDRIPFVDPQALQMKYLWAIQRLIEALSARRPLVVVLEDLHWADPSSVELLTKLLPGASMMPVLLCLVTRPERSTPSWKLVSAVREVLGDTLTELHLGALSEGDSRTLVANLLPIESLTETVRNTILRKAEGNPFFVEEVIRMLIDRGAIVQDNGRWIAGKELQSVEIPDNLQGLLLARIDRLPEDVKLTLRVASVIGRQFPARVLAYVLGEESPR